MSEEMSTEIITLSIDDNSKVDEIIQNSIDSLSSTPPLKPVELLLTPADDLSSNPSGSGSKPILSRNSSTSPSISSSSSSSAYYSSTSVGNHYAITTSTRHVLNSQARTPQATGDLTILLTAIQTTCKFIATNVRRARILNLIGAAGVTNVQGEEQKKLDVLSNEIMINSLRASGKVALMVSEENDDLIFIEDPNQRGKYCVVFDPLDGSSNIDAGVNIGTIFGIYRVPEGEEPDIRHVLRPGKEMVAAGYCMYGSSANLVISTGDGVNGYTLDNGIGEFILTHPLIKVPKRGKIYSFNEGNTMFYHEPVIKYLESVKFPKNGKPYSARYIGSMVADVHRTLLYGGIFGYPADKKSKTGKLRILYEGFPMAFLAEQAGGLATTGNERVLDVIPSEIHQRIPIFLGSPEDVEDLKSFFK